LGVIGGFGLSACNEVGHGSGPDDYGSLSQEELWSGEVRGVSQRSREITVRTDDGRTRTFTYDNRTQVIYRRAEYSIADLERGDQVVVRVQDRPGQPYADVIRVRWSVQSREGRDRLERLGGTVDVVNLRRGTFELRDRGRMITVSMPANPTWRDQDRFRRLRSGDRVQIEGYFDTRDRFELEAFL
jgi:hypothetical protein